VIPVVTAIVSAIFAPRQGKLQLFFNMRKNNFDGLSAGNCPYPRFFLLFSSCAGSVIPAAQGITHPMTFSVPVPSGCRSAAEGESGV
jgi:hypothetical protein